MTSCHTCDFVYTQDDEDDAVENYFVDDSINIDGIYLSRDCRICNHCFDKFDCEPKIEHQFDDIVVAIYLPDSKCPATYMRGSLSSIEERFENNQIIEDHVDVFHQQGINNIVSDYLRWPNDTTVGWIILDGGFTDEIKKYNSTLSAKKLYWKEKLRLRNYDDQDRNNIDVHKKMLEKYRTRYLNKKMCPKVSDFASIDNWKSSKHNSLFEDLGQEIIDTHCDWVNDETKSDISIRCSNFKSRLTDSETGKTFLETMQDKFVTDIQYKLQKMDKFFNLQSVPEWTTIQMSLDALSSSKKRKHVDSDSENPAKKRKMSIS